MLHEENGLAVLCSGEVFTERIISSYSRAMLDTWELELRERLLQNSLQRVRACTRIHNGSEYDESLWNEINLLHQQLGKDSQDRVCLFNEIRQALDTKNLRRAASLQIEMDEAMRKLEYLYARYLCNQI